MTAPGGGQAHDPACWNEDARYGPGKFSGERWFTLHYYEATLESGQDEEYGSVDEGAWYGVFILDASDPYDARIMAEDRDAYSVCIEESSDGFVTGVVQTRRDYEGFVFDMNGSEDSDS